METLTGCYIITPQDIASGAATISTGHGSDAGEATCQTTRALSKLHGKAPKMKNKPNPNRPKVRVLHPVTAVGGNLRVPVRGLNAGELILWASVGEGGG